LGAEGFGIRPAGLGKRRGAEHGGRTRRAGSRGRNCFGRRREWES